MFEWQVKADVTYTDEFFYGRFGADPSFKFSIYAFDTICSGNFDKFLIAFLVESLKLFSCIKEVFKEVINLGNKNLVLML